MLGPRRLGHSQNPSPQDPAQFSDTLLVATMPSNSGAHAPSRAVVGALADHTISIEPAINK